MQTLDDFLKKNEPLKRVSKLLKFEQEILQLHLKDFKIEQIQEFLKKNDVDISTRRIYEFIKKNKNQINSSKKSTLLQIQDPTNNSKKQKNTKDKSLNQIKNELNEKAETSKPLKSFLTKLH